MPDLLTGRHVLVTAGPTREPIDPVRFISNHSSGKQGYAIAAACAALGARVTLVAGPTALPDPDGVETIHIETARDMLAAVETALPADVFIAVAAVADWRPAQPSDRKLKLDKASFSSLPLVENPDILKTIAQMGEGRPGLVIGFAAETHDVEALAIAKRARKGCDWIVANDVSGDVMGGAENAVLLVTEAGSEAWDRAKKGRIAEQLAARIAEALD
ncbi:phosphopantothenoylcysteine decarboxylase [uncultured Maricaulis sp.]|uniref:phosphopantothenoylcysteine decarboxylase domain-containing protein n=1 Tax=uncultured Maricaulis sp. TaxID=174710 RepID=UPI0030D9C088